MFRVIVDRMPKTREECEFFSCIQGCTRPRTPCKCTFYDADVVGDKYLKGVRFCDSFIDMWSYKKLNLKTYIDGDKGKGHTVNINHSGLGKLKANLEKACRKGVTRE